VDIFCSQRFNPETPLEETMSALDHIVRSGQALYVGISSYKSEKTWQAAAILKEMGTPFIIHQLSYNILNRWVETDGLKDTLVDLGLDSIAFMPLAQGILSKKYLQDIPQGSRAAQGKSLDPATNTPKAPGSVQALDAMVRAHGQTLA
jgi:L-glyceraldehyde 3-phosphate reductase